MKVLERDLRDVESSSRDRDREVRGFWKWVIGLLIGLALTVVAGVVSLNVQIARLEERVGSLRDQVQGQRVMERQP